MVHKTIVVRGSERTSIAGSKLSTHKTQLATRKIISLTLQLVKSN